MKTTFRNSIILFSLLFLACILAANAQRKTETTQDVPVAVSDISDDDLENSFYAGISIGVPSGSLGDAASFLYGAFGGYSFRVSKCFSVGPEVNYTHFVGKDRDFGDITVEGEGFDFAGVSARVDYHLSDSFGVGANYGYGTYLEENSDFEDYITVGLDIRPVPGLVIRPEITFQNDSEQYSVRVYRTF
ncbi:outer membrane beta-barrel protein [Flagellimonas pacifica]|uniref:Outer membrane protein beta-barrel domain-containing protein n=1 Tax=Flagellimonas pacifica TaxID=1247520 RepID=A0A285MHJ4_9FLAO|nr:outer membrane beta-barrel protein [Allomuricauda parva]SNY94961.1 Outer membrane protein beta-barrel domain-containing protein [Allomuricauda parva]